MFRNEVGIAYREAAIDAVLPRAKRNDVGREATARQWTLTAERAVDNMLSDSFPASDPPSWTLGIIPSQPERTATNAESATPDVERAATVTESVIVPSAAKGKRRFVTGMVSLAGVAGIVLLVPIVILLIGSSIALVVRGVFEAARAAVAQIYV